MPVKIVEKYLIDLAEIYRTGGGQEEESYYSALENLLNEVGKKLKPRHTRDIGRLISLVKSFALLNLWFRCKDGSTIVADKSDIE